MSAASEGPTLREVAWPDIPTLAGLDEELFGLDAWAQSTWWAELARRPRRAYAVLADGPQILGYAGADLGGEVADVMTIAVAPAARGNGHGRRLVDWLVATARNSQARELMLEVRADNAPARGLYERAGFCPVSVRRRYYQPGGVDALILRKDLS